MKLPPDWDEPSHDNKEICDKFTYGTFDYSGQLPYRLFAPDTEEKVPLVVYLHGADAYGKDKDNGCAIVHMGSRDIYEVLKDVHPDLHYTEYRAGLMKEAYELNPHCSWVPAGRSSTVKEWMFSKEK